MKRIVFAVNKKNSYKFICTVLNYYTCEFQIKVLFTQRVAQLVARLFWVQKVIGSNPVALIHLYCMF